ncbi:MAG: M1 family metallopeptidase [Polyangiaceae bacterium]
MTEGQRRKAPRAPLAGVLVVLAQIAASFALLYAALFVGASTRGLLVQGPTARALDRLPPPPRSGPPKENLPGPDDAPKVASYQLRAALDPSTHTVTGSGTITFTNVSKAPISELWVHLYLNAFENTGTRFMRKTPNGFRGVRTLAHPGGTDVTSFRVREFGDAELWPADATTPGDAADRTDIRVPLPEKMESGATIHVDVAFVSRLPSIVLRTGFDGTFHMVAQWFPKIAKLEDDGAFAHFPFERFSEFYADYGDYDVSVDVPDTFRVGAVGELESSVGDADRRVDRYRATGVHDFAFAAWDGFSEQEDATGPVKIRCLYPHGYGGVADEQIEAAKRGLEVYGAHYGAYPYSTLTLVHPPPGAEEAGGMEYPTLITTGGPFWLAVSTTRSIPLLTLHELGHQWFYGLVGTNEHAFPFLDEGGATYATGVAAKELYGEHQLSWIAPGSVGAAERVFAANIHAKNRVSAAADDFETGNDYALLVYYRAATAFRTLDAVFDGAFDRALGRYARKHRFGHPTPDDLYTAIEAEGGPRARAFAVDVLEKQGWIDLGASLVDGRFVATRKGTLAVPVDVEVDFEDGSSTVVRWDDEATEFAVPSTDKKIVGGCVDPKLAVLLDENIADNCVNERPARAKRTTVLAVYTAELLANLVAP